MAIDVDGWIASLQTRHRAAFTNSEFLKAVRALSARYVERRGELPDRSPLDSAAKRAAFAAFYGPLHFLTIRHIVRALGATERAGKTLADLGCGTGVASSAWALTSAMPPRISGIDVHVWALEEAAWTWRALGLDARGRRGDVMRVTIEPGASIVAGWSVNELDQRTRAALLARLLDAAAAGSAVLIAEPISRRATPWWPEWETAFKTRGGRSDDWRFDAALPPALAEIDEGAGFRRDALSAKTLWIAP